MSQTFEWDIEKEQRELQGKSERKLIALLAIFLGCWGLHKFYLGLKREGLILLLSTIFLLILCSFHWSGLILLWIPYAIGITEGIIYLRMSDSLFNKSYQHGRKKWL